MTDLELTKACAEAMGWEAKESAFKDGVKCVVRRSPQGHMLYCWERYDPLHDDAQAMALVKRFKLSVHEGDGIWEVDYWTAHNVTAVASNADLNRAIVQCVAHLQSPPDERER